MIASSIFVLVLGVSIFGGKASDSSTPSRNEIGYIEEKVILPSDAPGRLSRYQRYYAWTIDDGKRYLYAVYIYDGLLPPDQSDARSEHVHPVQEQAIPKVSNGGCGVITFYVDPRGDRTPSLYCNAVGPVSFSKN